MQHGKRADGIVRNMLLHARGASASGGASISTRMIDEALNLAYHGARAEKSGFQHHSGTELRSRHGPG